MANGLILTTKRAAFIFEAMLSCRRDYCADNQFFKMTDVWKFLCEDSEQWKIKFFHRRELDQQGPQAAVSEFDQNVRLTVDARLWANAERGDKLSNFVLGHEIGHLQLRHNARFATRQFQMITGKRGLSVIPQSLYELEANFAAVSFQCGTALQNQQMIATELADRSFCDVSVVKNAQRMVQLDVFQQELARPRPSYPRVIF